MGTDADRKEAFGGPGIPPRWTHGAKDGVGTAYASSSRLWFTIWNGVVTEVYYPTVDRPQLRDLQFLVTDGETFFHEEKRHLRSRTERLSHHVLGYKITNSDPEGRYSIVKEVLSDPHLPCLLVNTILSGEEPFLNRLRLYALCAPHLGMGGWGNNARVVEIAGRKILTAEKDGVWLALAATVPFSRLSCGYVGRSDGWTDLASDYRMDWEFDRATDGNLALTGELDLGDRREFAMGLAFGDGLHNAATTLLESLAVPFGEQRERYTDQWNRSCRRLLPLEKTASDGGDLYHGSYSLLLAHEDKTYPGAFIASLSIPWGESKDDDDRGGYHLVWTRDLVNTATGLLAAGNTESPLRALIYLAVSRQADGGFSQNFWIDGEPYWRGVPRACPVRDPEGGRSRHRGLPARAGCRAQGGHSGRPVLAAVQPRRVRAERGWRAVHRVWEGTRVASPHRGAGGGITSWPPDGRRVRSFGRWRASPPRPGCCRNRSGTSRTVRISTCTWGGPPVPPGR
ncbi:MAG: glycoside hydrolase family 15 protein [Candidatus Deferrimicrobium sp.]